MSKRNFATKYSYQRLRQNDENDENYVEADAAREAEEQFIAKRKLQIPWKALSLAVFLFFGGIVSKFINLIKKIAKRRLKIMFYHVEGYLIRSNIHNDWSYRQY